MEESGDGNYGVVWKYENGDSLWKWFPTIKQRDMHYNIMKNMAKHDPRIIKCLKGTRGH
jgi:hypothetical protein